MRVCSVLEGLFNVGGNPDHVVRSLRQCLVDVLTLVIVIFTFFRLSDKVVGAFVHPVHFLQCRKLVFYTPRCLQVPV